MEKKSAMDIFVEQQAVEEEEFIEEEPMVQTMGQATGFGDISAARQKMEGLSPMPPAERTVRKAKKLQINQIKTSEDMQLEKEPIKVRETGSLGWRRVIVPPNVYVVHTRINTKQPVNIGLGISFLYRPNKDAYLIIPAAMQTIGVVANCISKEKQGINILAYVQWQINDISVAYRKLDFSDSRDPLGIVNAQLREQAEAAIKDKISTMSVEEVLTDKAPIIEELTARLKLVAEGQRTGSADTDAGLGIKIITVQIREALVCSENLWTDLQSHFRYEQKKASRISYLTMEQAIRTKELESRKNAETSEAEATVEIERIKQQKQTEALQLRLKEESERFRKEQESIRERVNLEEETAKAKAESRERLTAKENELKLRRELEILKQNTEKAIEEARVQLESSRSRISFEIEEKAHAIAEDTRLTLVSLENEERRMEKEKVVRETEAAFKELLQKQQDALDRLTLEEKLARLEIEHGKKTAMAESDNQQKFRNDELNVKIERMRQEINNLRNERVLLHELIQELPEISASLPEIKELKVLQTGGDNSSFDMLANFLTKILSLAGHLGIKIPGQGQAGDE